MCLRPRRVIAQELLFQRNSQPKRIKLITESMFGHLDSVMKTRDPLLELKEAPTRPFDSPEVLNVKFDLLFTQRLKCSKF